LLIANGQSQLKNPGTKRWWWLNPLRAGVGVPFLLAALPVLALNPDKSLLQYNCRAWTRQNGLPANGVKAIAQTRDGYLWLGTAQGLVRFDGVEFKLAEMPKSPSFGPPMSPVWPVPKTADCGSACTAMHLDFTTMMLRHTWGGGNGAGET